MSAVPRGHFESRDLDESARAEAGGRFHHGQHGTTHYELGGPLSPRTVVLIHGFSVPSFIWEPTFAALAGAGRRVLRYDLFGRGYSDRPQCSYGLQLYLDQLQDLLHDLGCNEVDLVALSMGAPIAAAFTIANPDCVRRMALIGPSGTKPVALGAWHALASLPGVGQALFALLGNELMMTAIARDFFDPAYVERFIKQYRKQMLFRGFRMAILSTVRSGCLGSFASMYRGLAALQKPILIIWGEKDRTVPFQDSDALLKILAHAEFLRVPGAGHIPHWERPEMVNGRLLDFLS